MEPVLTVRETLSLYAGYYRAPRDVAETIDLVGLASERRRASRQALRRAAAPARRRARADRRRRSSCSSTSRRRASTPSARRQAWEVIASLARPGQDGLPDHALHGRGPVPGRPGGDHPRRADRRRGAARRARRPRRRGDAESASLPPPGVDPAELPAAAGTRRRRAPERRRSSSLRPSRSRA